MSRRVVLIEAREQRFPTQEAVAEHFGISRSLWSQFETGDRTPRLPMAKRIASYFALPIEVLFPDDECHETRQTDEAAVAPPTDNEPEPAEVR